jgi:branched-chain amino acid transport system permease protein
LTLQSLALVSFAGLQAGCIYALLALSYFIILSATGVLNFAQGEWMMLAAILGVALLSLALPYPVALLASLVSVTVLAAAAERLIIRPLNARNAPIGTMIVALLGLMIVIRYSSGALFGREEHPLAGPVGSAPLLFGGGIFILPQTLLVFATTIIAFTGVRAFLRNTPLGRSLRVASIDPVGAQLVGVNLGQVRLWSFAIGGFLAACVAWLYAPLYAAGYQIGIAPGIKGFIALIIGGLGSPLGPLLGGLIVGLLEVSTARYLSSLWSEASAFAVFIAVLLIRPKGLLATKWGRE